MPPKKKLNATSKTELLGVIANLAPFHGGNPPRELVARRAGYGNAKTPAFKMAIKRAEKRGQLDLSDKQAISLTELGSAEAPDVAAVFGSNEQAHEKIKSELSPKMKEAFDLLHDGQPCLRSTIASRLEYKSEKEPAFKMLLNRIRDKGFLDFIDKFSVQLSDVCFPMGRDLVPPPSPTPSETIVSSVSL